MPEELLKEIKKLEVRLKEYLRENETFTDELAKSVDELKQLNNELEEMKGKSDDQMIGELIRRRLEATKALSKALNKSGEAEHEKSHLLESYGDLILALEEEFQESVYGSKRPRHPSK